MENIIDDIEKDNIDKFEITETPINIISFDDLTNKIEYQLNPMTICPYDRHDYIKWFCLNILNVPKEEFPSNVMSYINEENIDDYHNFMSCVEYNIKKRLGITFNNDDTYFDNIYNIYYFFFVNPESLLVDYLLEYHFYKKGYDFKEVYEQHKLNNAINSNVGDVNVDPIAIISGVKKQYSESNNKEFNKLEYKDKINSFINYAKLILLNYEDFKFYNFFKDVNEFAPCDNYDNLDDQINIFLNISYESDELISDWFVNYILNIEYHEPEVNEKIIMPFFTQIRDFEVNMAASISY